MNKELILLWLCTKTYLWGQCSHVAHWTTSCYSDHLWQPNSNNTCWFLDTALFLSFSLLQTALYALMSIHFLSLTRFRAGVYSSFYGTMWTDRRSIAKRCGSENFLWQTLLEEMPSHFNSLICLTVTSLLLPSTQKSESDYVHLIYKLHFSW